MSPRKRSSQPRTTAKGGRPSKCTPALRKRICKLIEAGNFIETACASVGIDEKTLRNWRAAGDEGREPYAAFLLALKQAEAKAEVSLVRILRSGKQHKYVAAAILLERRWRPRWSRGELEYELRAQMAQAEIDAKKSAAARHKLEAEILEAKAEQLKGGSGELHLHLHPDSKEFADYARQTWGFNRSRLLEGTEVTSHEGKPAIDGKPSSGGE